LPYALRLAPCADWGFYSIIPWLQYSSIPCYNKMTETALKYSVIVLLEEQHEDFARYIRSLHDLFSKRGDSFEIIIMANGTGGFLRNKLPHLNGIAGNLMSFEFNTRTRQAVCLKAGLKESNGEIIVACGFYQQITNDSLGRLLDSLDDETDIISPWRRQRVDSRFRRFRSAAFNALVRKIIRTDLHDLNCTVRIFRREVLEETQLYGNMYRYLPILAAEKGFRTKEMECEHYQEQGGKSGPSNLPEYFTRGIDLLTLYFNTRFTRKPLRFFSGIGILFLAIGLFVTSYIFAQKFLLGQAIGDRPILLIGILLMVLGVQAASVGLLGEIIVFAHGRQRREYTIEKIV
jgi:hypothetical protein